MLLVTSYTFFIFSYYLKKDLVQTIAVLYFFERFYISGKDTSKRIGKYDDREKLINSILLSKTLI